MYDVSVVIPNYNGIKYLEHCLEALEKQRDVAFETIIVDNCSQDGSASLAKEKFPQCCYLSLDQNYGFCRAVNEGIKKAAAPFVVLLNNDTEVEPEFLKNLLDCISKDERIFSVEARMMQYHRRELIDSAGTSYSALGWASANGKDKTKEKFLTSRKVFAACAGAAIYRKSDILMRSILHIWKTLISDIVQGFTDITMSMSRQQLSTMWEAGRAAPGIMNLR